MLLSQTDRDRYFDVAARWTSLKACLKDPAHRAVAADVSAAISPYLARWNDFDKQLLSDPDEIKKAAQDIESAEAIAAQHGCVSPKSRPPEQADAPPLTLAEMAGGSGHQVSRQAVIDSGVDKAVTGMFDLPKVECKDYLPEFICEGRTPGLGDVPWWVWALGGTGVLAVGGFMYANYRVAKAVAPVAVPLALSAYAPGVLPAYQAMQKSRGVPSQVAKAVDEELSR